MQKKSNINVILVLGILILSVSFVSADIIATMGMQGLEFVHPGLATTVRTVMCVTSPAGVVGCAANYIQGKIIGTVSGEVMQTIAEVSPDAVNAIATYNQIKGYVDQGANIINKLQINEKGEVEEAQINFEEEADLSKIINFELEENTIVTNGNVDIQTWTSTSEFAKKTTTKSTKITLTEENDVFTTKYFNGLTKEEKELVFENIDVSKENYFKIDDELGSIVEATFTAGEEGGIYSFGDVEFELSPGQKVEYKGFPDRTSSTYEFDYGANINRFSDQDLTKFKDIYIGGKNVSFVNEDLFIIDGGIDLRDWGILLDEGVIIFERMNINHGVYNPNSDAGVYLIKNQRIADIMGYDSLLSASYVQIDESRMEIHSGERRPQIKVEFLGGNDFLNVNEKSFFTARVGESNSLKFLKTEGKLELTHSAIGGASSTILENDGHEITFAGNKVNSKSCFKESCIVFEDIVNGKYLPVEMEIKSYAAEMRGKKIVIDKESNLLMLDKENEERIFYKRTGLSSLLKQGVTEEQLNPYLEYLELEFGTSSPYYNQGEWNRLSKELVAELLSSNISLNDFKSIRKEMDPHNVYNMRNFRNVAKEGSYAGFNVEQIKDLTNVLNSGNIIGGADAYSQEKGLRWAIREYDGENYEQIKQSLIFTKKYNLPWGMHFYDLAEDHGFRYSQASNKEDLINEISRVINSEIDSEINMGDYRDERKLNEFAVLINELHNAEGISDGTDDIRKGIVKNLNLKSKYMLISKANPDLYTSTFLLIYEDLPDNTIERIRTEIDPDGKYWMNFILQMGSENKADDLLAQNPDFFMDIIENSLDQQDVIKNGAFLTNTFIEIYEKPEFEKEKTYLKDFLLEKYNSADTKEKKGVFGYLIKLNEEACNDPTNPSYQKLCMELPPLPNLKIPTNWASDNKIAAKFYFYKDEGWFGTTIKDYQKPPYNFNLIEKDDSTAVLKKIVNGKELKVVLTLDKSDIQKTIDGDEFDIIAHRGHSFHLDDTFSGTSKKEKIFYLGSCGSFGETPNIQKEYPNSYLISDENTGQGAVNNWASYAIMHRLGKDSTNWEELSKDLSGKNGLIFPHEKSQLLLRYINQIEEF